MSRKQAPQKLISFSENKADFDKIKQDMKDGWVIVNLTQSGNYFIGIMEKISLVQSAGEEPKIYIPPRKKIKISY